MLNRNSLVLALISLFTATLGPAHGVNVPFHTNFDLDKAGKQPGLGGANQPSSTILPEGSSILVAASELGLEQQPATLSTLDGAATALQWSLAPGVSGLGVDINFRISFDSLYSGTIFDVSGPSGVSLRLRNNSAGQINLLNFCATTAVGTYTIGTPVNVVVRYSPPSAYWVIVDGENNGFEDNLPLEGDSCVPGNLTQLTVYAWRSSLGNPVTVAFDNLVVDWLPIFVDGFESSDTSLWSATVP